MAAKKVDELEECLEGEMSKTKATVEDRISSVEDKVPFVEDKIFNLYAMVKMLENQIQTTASKAKRLAGRMTNSEFRRRDDEVEIMEERGGRDWERRSSSRIEDQLYLVLFLRLVDFLQSKKTTTSTSSYGLPQETHYIYKMPLYMHRNMYAHRYTKGASAIKTCIGLDEHVMSTHVTPRDVSRVNK
ncbi:hypothetical protein M5K25_012718 [Dendrobium thyrsiflorum]|uniref:Uncharacterized protein n=1 Tax=Dendrobium thyrsiflorum TaxID=117978 RepID=A0ABD0UXU1_DENTH